MYVKIINNKEEPIPEGSVIKVTKTLKKSYTGIWSSSVGTYTVTVKKVNCKKYNP